jgi:hypothetical protein
MTVIASAGPRTRLQLVRVPVRESGDPAKRYQVRVHEDDGLVVLRASKAYHAAREAFEREAAWRGWEVRQ